MKDLVQNRLENYHCRDGFEELMALKEITQEVALYAFHKVGFFEKVSFLGGTCLRIVHGLDRFSEDLDFSTKKPDSEFNLNTYFEKASVIMSAYGYDLEVNPQDLKDKSIQGRFLKDDSIKKVLTFKHLTDKREKIKIKFEVDTNPPAGAIHDVGNVDFPQDFLISIYDRQSLMAGKINALLTREYLKGRDWYDLLWYISQKITPNYRLLTNSLNQMGPWKEKGITPDSSFVREELARKIEPLDWADAVRDVKPFLSLERAESLELWGKDFFLSKIGKI